MDFEKDLGTFGPAELQSDQNRGAFILHLVSRFSEDYCNAIDGRSQGWSKSQLLGGAKINHLFHNVFGQALKMINPTDFLSDEDIRMAIRSSTVSIIHGILFLTDCRVLDLLFLYQKLLLRFW
jgi:dynamin 1-like protein